MSKILILANSSIGLYKFRKELIQELIKNGNAIYISSPGGEFIKQLVNIGCIFIETFIDRRGKNINKDIKLILHYYKIIKRVEPDKIITYTIKPNIYGGIVARIKKKQYYVNVTGLGTAFQGHGMIKKFISIIYKSALYKATKVFFENAEIKQIFVDNYIVSDDKCIVLNGAGVNLETYGYADYPPEENPISFLFIGRLMKEKGIEELFEVAKKIKSQYSDIIFDVVGPFEDDYKKEVEKLVVDKIIIYRGYKSDVRYNIEKCNCFVLPSYHEGMANTLLESASMGRPLITSNISGCKETVIEGITGLLINVKDAESLYKAINKFIKLPYNKKKQMGIYSRKHMVEKFDRKIIVKKTISVIMNE